MSTVTNAILYLGVLDEHEEMQKLAEVNAYFENQEYRQHGFVSIDDKSLPHGWYGGAKMLEASLAVGAFNHLFLDEFVEYLQSLTWDDPEMVQLIVMQQDDNVFRIININNGGD